MAAQSTESIMMPAKFLSLMLHLIIVTMAYFSYHDNILAAYPDISRTSDDLYVGARVSFLACNTLTIIFLIAELIILFIGVTIFREKHNFFTTTLHFLGAILWSSYTFQQWQFSQLWFIWLITSLLPLSLEILAIISVCKK